MSLTPVLPQNQRRAQTALSYLSAARQANPDPETAGVYLTALSDVDPALLERACRELANEPRGEYGTALPDVGTIRRRCEALAVADQDRAERAKLLPMPASRRNEPTYHCLQCFDEPNGWLVRVCPGDDVGTVDEYHCGRVHTHARHTFAMRCECLPTNPVIRWKKDRMRSGRTAVS